jgi:hypothetical protein
VLHALADRLAQAEGQWKPFERTGLRRIAYPNAERSSCFNWNDKVTA